MQRAEFALNLHHDRKDVLPHELHDEGRRPHLVAREEKSQMSLTHEAIVMTRVEAMEHALLRLRE